MYQDTEKHKFGEALKWGGTVAPHGNSNKSNFNLN